MDWPWAAACSNRKFSACCRPGWPDWIACSHSPQLAGRDRRRSSRRSCRPGRRSARWPPGWGSRRHRSWRPAPSPRDPRRRGSPHRCPVRSAGRRRSGSRSGGRAWTPPGRRRRNRCRTCARRSRRTARARTARCAGPGRGRRCRTGRRRRRTARSDRRSARRSPGHPRSRRSRARASRRGERTWSSRQAGSSRGPLRAAAE